MCVDLVTYLTYSNDTHTDAGAARKILIRWMYAVLVERFDKYSFKTYSTVHKKVIPEDGDLAR